MYGETVLLRRVVSFSYTSYRTKKDSTKKLLEFLAGMPKANSPRIAEAQRQRQNVAKKAEKYAPSTVYLQVLGSGAYGAPNTLYMFTDHKRYLFNCGECTQRLAHEHKVKLSKLNHIFITAKTWRNIGGLPGLSLTLQDVGVPRIMLHGPEGLDELYNATKRFVIMKDMSVTMAKCTPSEDFEDSVMTVKYVLLGPQKDIICDLVKDKPAAKKPKLEPVDKELEAFIKDDTDYYKAEEAVSNDAQKSTQAKKTPPRPRLPSPPDRGNEREKKKTENVLKELQKQPCRSVAFICTLKKRLGTLCLEKCVELGVRPGPMLGQLKSGHDVVLPDGRLVLAADVKTPDDPGPVFIVLDVPDITYLRESDFSSHFDNGRNRPEKIPTLIVHFTPPHVFHDPAYRAFMAKFGPTTRHLTLNSQNSCLGSEAVHRTQQKLHLLDPDIFPLLKDVSVPAVWSAQPPPLPKTNSPIKLKGLEELKTKIALAQFQNIINMEGSCKGDCRPIDVQEPPPETLEIIEGRTLTMFHLRPRQQLDRSQEPKLHIQEYIQETMDVGGFVQSLEQFRRMVDSMRYARSGSAREYPKVVFLGTGSCIPSKTRNTSAIVLRVSEDKSILLDCGEGTFGQLVRFYGPKKVNAFLKTLKAVYISHLHADHHIGLIGVLQARREAIEENDPHARPDPVYLLAPGQIMSWLTLYDQLFERIRQEITLVPNQNLLMDAENPHPELVPALLCHLGLDAVATCTVHHCPNAFGVALVVQRHKITYSGDTIPCEALVKCGENSTLLIHEATMEDELVDEARTKMHSTTTQAIEVGKQMNAQYTVLTHFSQRYARLPRLNPNILNDNNSVGIAFDNMQITINDLELLPHMYAPLQLMFAEHCVEMELRAAHRARQKLRSPREGASDDIRWRKTSPGCGNVMNAVKSTAAYYRESNASRLRAQVQGPKGVPATGSLPRARTSAGTQNQRSHSKSRNSSPAVFTNNKAENSSGGSTQLLGRDSSVERQFGVLTPPGPEPTLSEMSNVCGNQKIKSSSMTPDGCSNDTSSKWLNSVSLGGQDHFSHERSKSPSSPSPSSPSPYGLDFTVSNTNGYGKPLVTPLNKRLTLRRDVPHVSAASAKPATLSEKMSPIVRSRSPGPVGLKADNRPITAPISGVKQVLSKPKAAATTKRCGSVHMLLASSVVQPERSPVSMRPVPVKGLKGSTSNPAHHIHSAIPVQQRTTGFVRPATAHAARTERKPEWNFSTKVEDKPRTALRETSEARSNHSSPPRESPSKPSKIPRYSRPSSAKSYTYKTEKKDLDEGSSKHYQDVKKSMLSYRDKQNASKKKKPTKSKTNNSASHSVRSFKPRLEDIKSSFVLLNKKTGNSRAVSVPKPPPLDDKERQKCLNEVKKKFTSRDFHHNAKYDKIEGLNWISWK